MPGTPDLFVVCKQCNSEVSPYITECPYCGTRLRKRAPKIDREDGEARPRQPRRMPRPSLGPLRSGEIPGIAADPTRRPYATIALVALSMLGYLVVAALDSDDLALSAPDGDPWRYATSLFTYANPWFQLAVVLAVGVYGWRLELRHGPLLVVFLFVLLGAGGNAVAVALDGSTSVIGAPGAALGLLAAWAAPDVLRARRGEDHDADLLGTLVIALVIALMPLGVRDASAAAALTGLVGGIVAGLALSRTAAAR